MVLYKECIISGKHKVLCFVRKEESVIKKRKDWIGSKAKKRGCRGFAELESKVSGKS